ncbi:hypothetical protein RZS28_14770 [Methylocapsa polymorpha]|uniref:Moybdenum cofactor oxidoreductase dimerisation domain-containing protein n=1 Tax=Methylocapsa polymorpha TaxID=3080828 RepID=A0ABZ0HRS1_9HYPH|nr:hypothetical protein RZS28_14770 [Methylocapsa sp. RX1]
MKLAPVTRMSPRSFITNISSGDKSPVGAPTQARGVAFGGDSGVARLDLSIDGGKSWRPTQLGKDEGKYGFRQWRTQFILPTRGKHTLMIRYVNSNGEAQPNFPIWSPEDAAAIVDYLARIKGSPDCRLDNPGNWDPLPPSPGRPTNRLFEINCLPGRVF